MTKTTAYRGARIFDGQNWHDGCALVVTGGKVAAIVGTGDVPADGEVIDLAGGLVAPGFIDLQANGGGGVLFNDTPTVEGIRTMCRAHAKFGTTALLPTVVTDAPEVTRAALDAGVAAASAHVPGFLGLHVEGPHLSLAKKGIHEPSLIRPMEDADFEALSAAAKGMPVLMTTVAPETVPPARITALAAAGVRVSLGHSAASVGEAQAAEQAGATLYTHLFNAMSQISQREPGVVGAALESEAAYCGLIADGVHVDRHCIAIAMRAKRGPGKLFLITDAMSPLGTDMTEFMLNGRRMLRRDGRLTGEDGTLAGADLDMAEAVRFMYCEMGVDLAEVLRMASLYPAEAVGAAERLGHLKDGAVASFVHLSDDLQVEGVWIEGQAAASL
ncbi:N-acetylglucosamine-6-phosphate deacetylase [Consotaella salsifontis]|uniref:N-acetylglucosamine 6-phosphate deacetylase n=1 Tax=Consotaella salsifontis TaxID=1365950 RepID=A0A1T4QRZ2_9HYPH|nr:N-acetylglucosamine-6-phosphate deacetylase [Consotaella salsifontis]SKA06018.1 N-acetylglucosamine 6-phosphate deacetylase [Consotaella salsifontis]